MPGSALRLVVDTNVLLAGLVSKSSASQKIVDALKARKAVPLLSSQVLAEYRAVLFHPAVINRFDNLTPRRIELALYRLRYIGDEYKTGRVKFDLPRDPRDAMFVELAIVGAATHIVSLDADLLTLPTARTAAGKRFRQRLPKVTVLEPGAFVAEYAAALGLR